MTDEISHARKLGSTIDKRRTVERDVETLRAKELAAPHSDTVVPQKVVRYIEISRKRVYVVICESFVPFSAHSVGQISQRESS